jgi:hypothetical protein
MLQAGLYGHAATLDRRTEPALRTVIFFMAYLLSIPEFELRPTVISVGDPITREFEGEAGGRLAHL